MAAKAKEKTRKGVIPGWRIPNPHVRDMMAARRRRESCPIAAVREAIDLSGPHVEFVRGLWGADQIACGRWILLARIPDDEHLSAEWCDAIMHWVRNTL